MHLQGHDGHLLSSFTASRSRTDSDDLFRAGSIQSTFYFHGLPTSTPIIAILLSACFEKIRLHIVLYFFTFKKSLVFIHNLAWVN